MTLPDETRPRPKRGAVTELAAMADLTKGVTDEAKRLLVVGADMGIPTSLNSLINSIHMRKRALKGTLSPRPAPAKPTDAALMAGSAALKMLDAAIADLQATRKIVAELEKNNRDLHLKIEGFRKMVLK